MNYVGIDLGTTNSAICSYNGEETRIWKSAEQNDVTPSVLYIDRRGNKHVGKRAYDSVFPNRDHGAMLFKRLMGSSTPIKIPAADLTMTPEECSAEVLRVLFGYLPEEVRNSEETGTVITVPAAFDQMQKNATTQAAELAEIGQVALMQEPVAAIMSVMKARSHNGISAIYDLGGGTLDIAVAENIDGQITLLAHGGIAFCGGRDFDRLIVDNIVKPWLFDKFNIPDDVSINPKYKQLMSLAAWASERAKIELSARDGATIVLSEAETRIQDESGEDIYVEIPLARDHFDRLIEERIRESVVATREVLSTAGMDSNSIDRIVFIGGPTNYKPLRDAVSTQLGLPANSDINPMTAVAEGAALFAESIDWASRNRTRKSNRGKVTSTGKLDITFNFTARTPQMRAKIVTRVKGQVAQGSEFQVDSLDTGWTSGRVPLSDGADIDVSLSQNGKNIFKVFVFDAAGGSITLDSDKIEITRTAATVDAIPASHSIGVEVLEKLGGTPTIVWLVRAGDQLPKKGRRGFKAGESLKAGSAGALNFKVLEGESDDPADNRPIGTLKVTGTDFDDGVIPAGADLECEFEMLDSGSIVLSVSVPSVGGTFHSDRNFYSRQDGQIDFTAAAAHIREERDRASRRLDEIENVVSDKKLDEARRKLDTATGLDSGDLDIECAQEAREAILEVRKLLSQVKKDHLKDIRQIELDHIVALFDNFTRENARSSEQTSFDNLARTAQRSIDRNDNDFEGHLSELRTRSFEILWRQDWFVVERFKHMESSPHQFADANQFEQLVAAGRNHMNADDIDALRGVVAGLSQIRISAVDDNDMLDLANIVKG